MFRGCYLLPKKSSYKFNKYYLLKLTLSLSPVLLGLLNFVMFKIYFFFNPIKNIKQIAPVEIIFILISLVAINLLVLAHAKNSGFMKKQWISIVFCYFLLIWITFGFIYFAIEYYSGGSNFSYSDSLIQQNRIKSVLSSNAFQVDDSQKYAIESIIINGENNNDKLELKINGQQLYLTKDKIGDNWSDFYYENYLGKYNAFDIIKDEPISVNQTLLTNDSIMDGKYSLKYFQKSYICVTVRMFISDENNKLRRENRFGCIMKENYDFNKMYSNNTYEDLVLLFEKNNYYNYLITESNSPFIILASCLSESNTLLDNKIGDINTNLKDYSISLIDYLYYSGIVITTVGFGDMSPISEEVKILTIIEALMGLIVMGFFIAKAFENVGKKNRGVDDKNNP